MASHARIHIAGALYYVVHYLPAGKAAPASSSDFHLLRSLFGAALEQHKLRAYGFFFNPGPDYLRYVVRVADEPVSRLVTGIEGRRAGVFGASRRDGRRIFVRHSIRLLDPNYLPRVVRYLHLLPVRLRLARSPDGYAWSSDRAHRGLESYGWLSIRGAWHCWPIEASMAQHVYRTVVMAPLDPDDVHMIEHGSELDSRIIGNPEFIRRLPGAHRLKSRMTLHELCESVCRAFAIRPDELRSHSHVHIFIVARAFLYEYATRREGYKKNRVAAYLHHSDVDMAVTSKRCRAMHADVFKVPDIPEDGSLRKIIE